MILHLSMIYINVNLIFKNLAIQVRFDRRTRINSLPKNIVFKLIISKSLHKVFGSIHSFFFNIYTNMNM